MPAPSRNSPARRSLILDPIHPRDYRELAIVHTCEQCSHFDRGGRACTLGYVADNHVEAEQSRLYRLHGKVAFCRFSEID